MSGNGTYQETRVDQAEELWTILNNPCLTNPAEPELKYPHAIVVLAKKGLKFLTVLRETQSFAKARQASKSWLRACRHKELNVVEPEEEFNQLLAQYKRKRKTMLLENEEV